AQVVQVYCSLGGQDWLKRVLCDFQSLCLRIHELQANVPSRIEPFTDWLRITWLSFNERERGFIYWFHPLRIDCEELGQQLFFIVRINLNDVSILIQIVELHDVPRVRFKNLSWNFEALIHHEVREAICLARLRGRWRDQKCRHNEAAY